MQLSTLAVAMGFAFTLAGCTVGEDEADPDDMADVEGEQDTSVDADPLAVSSKGDPGVNGQYCKGSAYNCRFRFDDSRILTNDGDEHWGITPGASIRDGFGKPLATQTATTMRFNYGQTRLLAGKAHALGASTSNGSTGWYPIDHIKGEASFRSKMGNVDAKDPGQGKLACYEVRSTYDASLAPKKVVHNSTSANERAGDYLPLVRRNGEASSNLEFNVPGFGLGGAVSDHFRAGTKFQRVGVPTATGKPSITIPLWVKGGDRKYSKHSGDLTFLYGYVVGDGVKRFGWMAQDAVTPSTGCP